MKVALVALLGFVLSSAMAAAQLTQSDATADGKAFGKAALDAASGITDSAAAAETVPGYAGTAVPQGAYMGDPDKLVAEAGAIANANDGYRAVVDGNRSRPVVSRDDVDATVERGNVIADNPAPYATGVTAEGTTGQCVELPPSPGSAGTYTTTCNVGLKIISEPRSCPIPLTHVTRTSHRYQCTRIRRRGNICLQGTPSNCTEPDIVDEVIGDGCEAIEASGQCTMGLTSTRRLVAPDWRRAGVFYETYGASCSAPVATGTTGIRGWPINVTPSANPVVSTYLGEQREYVSSAPDPRQCQGLAGDGACSDPVEVCTDSLPSTRDVNGTQVTQACWGWTRTYQCRTTTSASDCSSLDKQPGCKFTREECLDDPQDGECKVAERVYTCPVPAGPSAEKQYVCGGDVYCVGTQCEPVVREASTEFKDAVVGLHAMDQAGKEFDEADYRLFKGVRETCSKPVFGLANCCGGNGIPLIGSCSAREKALAVKIDNGFVHYVGSYCSDSFFGVCTSKRLSFCSFTSKLTRILQEQGRPQLGKTWGKPKTPICDGYTIDEFARLDLSRMDFTEIYSEFVEAAKLPDEVQVAADIQQKITDYFARGGR